MGIFSYILIFIFLQQIMFINPVLGLMAYIFFFYSIGKSNRRRRNTNYGGYQRTYYSNTGQQSQDPRVINAIDIEFSEEEIS